MVKRVISYEEFDQHIIQEQSHINIRVVGIHECVHVQPVVTSCDAVVVIVCRFREGLCGNYV